MRWVAGEAYSAAQGAEVGARGTALGEGCWGGDVCARVAGSLAVQQKLTQDCKAATLQQ